MSKEVEGGLLGVDSDPISARSATVTSQQVRSNPVEDSNTEDT